MCSWYDKNYVTNWSFQLHSYREEMLMAHYQQCHLQMQRIMIHVIPQYSFTNFFSLHPPAVKMPPLAGNYNLLYLSRWLSLWSSGLWSSYFKGDPECEGSWYFLTSVRVAISKVIFFAEIRMYWPYGDPSLRSLKEQIFCFLSRWWKLCLVIT